MEKELIKNRASLKVLSLVDDSCDNAVEKFGHAIASPIRLKMFRQINQKPMTLVEIAKLNNVTNSTALFHLKLLHDGGLIEGRYLPGKKGKDLVYFVKFSGIFFQQSNHRNNEMLVHEQSVGVGEYVDADLKIINVADTNGIYHLSGGKQFSNDRFKAQILWTDGGKISYAFENSFTAETIVQELSFSLEICSEARFYRNDWKSDITFSVNNVELCTYTSPGDFGGIRGKLNPDWWGNENTQYGILINVSITDDGTYLNSQKVSKTTLSDLKLGDGNKILFSIYNKPNAEYWGGFNLFGKSFGNYPQDIILTAKYVKK